MTVTGRSAGWRCAQKSVRSDSTWRTRRRSETRTTRVSLAAGLAVRSSRGGPARPGCRPEGAVVMTEFHRPTGTVGEWACGLSLPEERVSRVPDRQGQVVRRGQGIRFPRQDGGRGRLRSKETRCPPG